MAKKFSLRAFIVTAILAAVVTGLQANLTCEFNRLKADISNMKSPLYERVPDHWRDANVKIVAFETDSSLVDILTFRRHIRCTYTIERTVDSILEQARTMSLPPPVYLHDGPHEPAYEHTLLSSLSPFGYTISGNCYGSDSWITMR